MFAPEVPESSPATFAGGVLDRYRHVCAFINSAGEEAVAFDPFVSDGVESGDRLLFFVDETRSAEPVNRLRHLGFDPAALLAEHRCEVRSWGDTYLRGGRFDQESALQMIDRHVCQPRSPRVRLWADMGWAVERPQAQDELIEFEARANFLHARHQNIVICTYDTARFDGAFIVDILRTHPMVLLGGVLQENPYFVAPSEFLRERGARAEG